MNEFRIFSKILSFVCTMLHIILITVHFGTELVDPGPNESAASVTALNLTLHEFPRSK